MKPASRVTTIVPGVLKLNPPTKARHIRTGKIFPPFLRWRDLIIQEKSGL